MRDGFESGENWGFESVATVTFTLGIVILIARVDSWVQAISSRVQRERTLHCTASTRKME